jgi:hypothetical protein
LYSIFYSKVYCHQWGPVLHRHPPPTPLSHCRPRATRSPGRTAATGTFHYHYYYYHHTAIHPRHHQWIQEGSLRRDTVAIIDKIQVYLYIYIYIYLSIYDICCPSRYLLYVKQTRDIRWSVQSVDRQPCIRGDVYIYMCMCICTCTCICVYISLHIFVYVCMCLYVSGYVCLCLHMSVYVCNKYIDVCLCMHFVSVSVCMYVKACSTAPRPGHRPHAENCHASLVHMLLSRDHQITTRSVRSSSLIPCNIHSLYEEKVISHFSR